MYSKYFIVFFVSAIIAGGIIFYMKTNDSSDPEQSENNIFDVLFNSKDTSEEVDEQEEEAAVKQEEEEGEGEENFVDSALGLFNKSKEELDNLYTIQPSPLPTENKPDVSFRTKNTYFLKSLDDSIKYCKNNSKFKELYYLKKYKKTYQELYVILNNKNDYKEFEYDSLVKKYKRILDDLNEQLSN